MLKKGLKKIYPFAKTFVLALFCCLFLAVISLFNFKPYNNNNSIYVKANNQQYSQEYLNFLNLSDEQKQNYGVIPRMFDIDISSLYTSSSYQSLLNSTLLPSEYSLYYTTTIYNNFDNVNRLNFEYLPNNVGNQKSTNICWAFASLTALESTLYKMGVVDTSTFLNFSELNLAYVSQVKNHGTSTIGGGTFDLAYEYLGYNLGPVYEQEGECDIFSSNSTSADISAQNDYINNFLPSAVNANFSALESYTYPSRSSCTTSSQKTDLRNAIKNHIYTYGAVTASIAYDSQYYDLISQPKYFYNPSSANVVNHLITLVGWDDNFHVNRYGQTLTGAYIAQNSWGESWGNNGYFYIMYDDAKVEENVAGFVRVSAEESANNINYNNFEGTTYENNFISYDGTYSYYQYLDTNSNYLLANFFNVSNVSGQYLSKIKVPTVISQNHKSSEFYVYVLPNATSNAVLTQNSIQDYLKNNFSSAIKIKNKHSTTSDEYLFTSCQLGFYTIELDKYINLQNNFFGLIIEYLSSPIYYRNNVDGIFDSISSKQRTYISSDNGSTWGLFEPKDSSNNTAKEILPVIVQTNYLLNDIEYVANDITQTYNGSNVAFDINVTNVEEGNFTIYYSLTGNEDDYSTSLNIKNVGNYKVYYKIEANFYNTISGSNKFFDVCVLPRPLNIEPAEQYKIYGSVDSILDFTFSNNVSGEKPKFYGALSREVGEDVGYYNITLNPANFYLQDNGAFKKDNYEINFTQNVKYQIIPRTLYIIPNLLSKIYGSEDPVEYTFSLSGLVNNEVPLCTGELIRESGEDVATYNIIENELDPITIYNNGTFKKDNYELYLNPNNQAFQITKKQIVVTPDANLQKVYGELDPVLTYTHTGEVFNEEASFYGALSRESGEDAGQYEITFNENDFYLVDNGSFKASNYTIYLTPSVMFTISYGALLGCNFESASFNYDGQTHYLIATNNSLPNVKITYSLQEEGEYSKNPIGFKDVNIDNNLNIISYVIFAKFECPNYNSVVKQATLTINKANIVVTPRQNQLKVYDGNSNIEVLYDYSGQINNEVPSFIGTLTCQNLIKDVNEYLIINNNLALENSQTFNKNNYCLVFDNSQNITFNITKRQIIISPIANQFKYYGKEDKPIAYTVLNLVNNETPNYQGALYRQEGENVGQYVITIGSLTLDNSEDFNNNNYQINFDNSKNFSIQKSNITVKVNDVHCYYSETPVFSYTLIDENLVDGTYVQGDNLNVSYSCAVTSKTKKNDSNIDYTIYATASNSNYNISIVYGQFFVEYQTYKVHFQVLQQTYTLDEEIEHFAYVSSADLTQIENIAKNINGYNFKYWKIESVDENGSSTGSYKRFLINQDYIEKETTIVADMEEIEYTATFYTNSDQTQDFKMLFTINSSTYIFETPFKNGYTFVNWYSYDGTNERVETKIDKGTIGDKSYYAKWQINFYDINLPNDDRFTFEIINLLDSDNNNSTLQNNNDIQVEYMGTFTFKINLEKPYSKSNIIVYYNTENDNNRIKLEAGEQTNSYKIENIDTDTNIFVEGVTINTYTINFIIDREVKKSITKTHGEGVLTSEYPNIPKKTNYDNTAPTWNLTQIESVENDQDIVAVYTPNVYNIIFVFEDGNTYSTTVTYGENVSDEVLKENYNLNMFEYFDYDANFFGINEDMVINVKIKSNIYILYIVLVSLFVVISLTIVALVLRKKSKSKLKWWAYVSNPNKNIKK